MATTRHRRRRTARRAVGYLVVGLLASGLVVAYGEEGGGASAAAAASNRPPAVGAGAGTGSEPSVVGSPPVSIRIAAIDVNAIVGTLGLNADNTVQVPANPAQTGWYQLGPSPGQLGSAVILGHVDSLVGPAVFYELRLLRKGDPVAVTLANGAVERFVVDRTVTYPNAKFPDQAVYGSHGFDGLQLVTCGGPFDHRAQAYTANVVVYTSLVSTTPSPTPKAEGPAPAPAT